MEPLITIRIERDPAAFFPGERLRFACQVDAIDASEVTAIEASVLWHTEGKGDEDLGVHFFERVTDGESDGIEICALHEFETELPRSPLSYEGAILKIRWSARVRVFASGGKEFLENAPFQLGAVVNRDDSPDEENAEEGVEQPA